MTTFYQIADVFFYVFHIALIIFNLFGWMVPRLRRWNLVTLGLTAFSWFVLGIFYGFGYCFLTDWHWQVRDALGYQNPYHSYIHFLAETALGVSVSARTVDILTAVFFMAAVTGSVITNIRDYRRSRNKPKRQAGIRENRPRPE